MRELIFKDMLSSSFAGIDPSSVKFSRQVVALDRVTRNLPSKILRRLARSVLYRAISFSGGLAAWLINPPHIVFAKGLGLTLSGLATQERLSLDDESTIAQIKAGLEKKRLGDTFLWGHDIDYSFPDGKRITSKTPNLVTTAFVANGFWDLFAAFDNQEDLKYFNQAVESILLKIPFQRVSKDEICYMYTPETDYHVHNANLLYAELVAKYLSINKIRRTDLSQNLLHAVQYTLNHFLQSGSFPYAGPPTINESVDNYHTGYVLRSIKNISDCDNPALRGLGLDEWQRKILGFYILRFAKKNIVRDEAGTLESHSLAESILVYEIFQDKMSSAEKIILREAISRTKKALWSEDGGYFINNIKTIGPFRVTDKTKMIRWSSAWMYLALSLEEKNNR